MPTSLRVFPLAILLLAAWLPADAAALQAPASPAVPPAEQPADPFYEGTYSIIARDPDTGELGMGVQSRAFAVGYRTWTARGGLAIWAHQASSNPYYGRVGMEMLAAGLPPEEALKRLVASDEESARRQVAVIDIQGRTAAFSGEGTSDWKGHRCGTDYCAQGNTLAGPEVVEAMARTFEATAGSPLPDRLLAALDAAQAAGGDRRGMQAAAMITVLPTAGAGGYSDVTLDLRVNDHPLPLTELRRLLTVFRSGEVIASARAAFAAGDADGALRTLQELRDRIPEKDQVWVALAALHLDRGERREALEAVARAVGLNEANRTELLRDRSLAALHDDPDFLELLRR
jgi:uncharacterized Ntn-hydrolase superfamily protein